MDCLLTYKNTHNTPLSKTSNRFYLLPPKMALMSNATTISRLDNKMRRPKIIARIFKIWDAMEPNTGVIYNVDFMLVDAEGSAIEGTIDLDEAETVREKMVEGMVFEFTNFQVLEKRPSYRTVNHEYHLKFTEATNVIGKITSFEPMRKFEKANCTVTLREIHIGNERFTASPLVIPTAKSQVQSLNLEQLPIVTVKELLADFATNAAVKCIAIIEDIGEAFGWYYNACPNHLTKLKGSRNEYKCDVCNTKIENPQPCYKFCVVVTDEMGEEADFVFLGMKGEEFIGCTALSLQIEHDIKKGYLPDKIKDLIGREFIFTVRYNLLSAKSSRPKFNVLNTTSLDVVSNTLVSSGVTPNTPAKIAESSKGANSRGKEVSQEEATSMQEGLPKMKTSKKRSRDED